MTVDKARLSILCLACGTAMMFTLMFCDIPDGVQLFAGIVGAVLCIAPIDRLYRE